MIWQRTDRLWRAEKVRFPMRSFFSKLSQSVTSQILPVIAAAIFGYYSGIYGLKDEICELRKENSELRDQLMIEMTKVYKQISAQEVLITRNEQYIRVVAYPVNKKLEELEKKVYGIEKDVAIILIKAENFSADKNQALSAKRN